MKNLFLALFLAIGLTSCNGIQNQENSQGEKTVKIGVITPLSGGASTYGTDIANAYKDALKKYKSKNPNSKIKFIFEDGKCNGKDAISAVQKLINIDKVDVIMPTCSGEAIGAGQIAQSRGVTILSPVASAPSISKIGDYMFRFWNDADASVVLANELNSKYKNIALISENTDYAIGLTNRLKKLYKGKIILEEKFQTNEKDFNILAQKIKKTKGIEAVIFLNQTESTGIPFIKAINSNGILEKFKGNIYGAYLFGTDSFLKGVGDLAEGLIEVQLDKEGTLGEKGTKYLEYFKEKYGIKSIELLPILSIEGAELIFDAVDAGNKDSDSIRNYFAKINKENPRNGFFGTYYFDKNGDAVGLKYKLVIIKNGKSIDYK